MAKAIDYVALTVITLLLTFCWSALAFDDPVGALIFSCALTLIVAVSVIYLRSKRGKPYAYDRLALEFSLKGNEYIINLLKSILKSADIDSGSNYILLKNSIIIACFKFGTLNISDVANVCNTALKFDKRRIFVITRGVDRRAYAVVQMQNVKLEAVKIRAVYKFLQKHGALPDLKPLKKRFSLRALVEAALSRSNFKSYAFSGIVLTLVSFITPLKIYYICVGSALLVLALLTLTPLGRGAFFSPDFSREMEQAASEVSDQISIDEIAPKDK